MNPITLLVPHIDLDIGSYCSFGTIAATIEQLKGAALKSRASPSRHHELLRSTAFSSTEADDLDDPPSPVLSGQSSFRQEWQPRQNFLEAFNYLNRQRDLLEVAPAKTWKLMTFESYEFQKAILQHEKLQDHLKGLTQEKRAAVSKELPSYEEAYPECTLHQFTCLMNDNVSMKAKAIDEYRKRYIERGEKVGNKPNEETK